MVYVEHIVANDKSHCKTCNSNNLLVKQLLHSINVRYAIVYLIKIVNKFIMIMMENIILNALNILHIKLMDFIQALLNIYQ